MTQLILDDEQARILEESVDSVELRDQRGRCLGYVSLGFTLQDVAIARRRLASNEPRYTTREVLEHLHSLESN